MKALCTLYYFAELPPRCFPSIHSIAATVCYANITPAHDSCAQMQLPPHMISSKCLISAPPPSCVSHEPNLRKALEGWFLVFAKFVILLQASHLPLNRHHQTRAVRRLKCAIG